LVVFARRLAQRHVDDARRHPDQGRDEEQDRQGVRAASTVPVAAEDAQRQADGDRDRTGGDRREPGDLAPLPARDGPAEDVLRSDRRQRPGEREGRQRRHDAPTGDRAGRSRGEGRHGEHRERLPAGARDPHPLADRQAAHPWHEGSLREHRAGLADRHQHRRRRCRGAHGREQPREHRLGVDDEVARLLQRHRHDLLRGVRRDLRSDRLRPSVAPPVAVGPEQGVDAFGHAAAHRGLEDPVGVPPRCLEGTGSRR
jgi:hypothetical protein